MHKSSTIFQRLTWLLVNELKMKNNQYLLILLTAFAILSYLFFNPSFSFTGMIDSLLNPRSVVTSSSRTIVYFNNNTGVSKVDLKFHLDFFPTALFIVGSIITSLSFIEYTQEADRRFHIALPAKTIEKWIVKVIWCLIIFPFFFLIMYHLFALVSYSWGEGMGKEYVRIRFFDPYIWQYMFFHFILQSFIIVAAAFFRKFAAVKTLLFGLGLYLFLVAARNVLIFSFFPNYQLDRMGGFFALEGWRSYLLGGQLSVTNLSKNYGFLFNEYTYALALALAFSGALYLSYCRFQEYEA